VSFNADAGVDGAVRRDGGWAGRGPGSASHFASANVAMDPQVTDKPGWVDALEESLLLAIGLFSLITWIVTVGLLGH
jgi:hypothetical protein